MKKLKSIYKYKKIWLKVIEMVLQKYYYNSPCRKKWSEKG